MVTRGASADASTPEVVAREKGFATLDQLRVGVKLHTLHAASNEYRLAEILSIQSRKSAPFFYVHYDEFNKRLDEWVPASRFDLSREVEFPVEAAAETKKAGHVSGGHGSGAHSSGTPGNGGHSSGSSAPGPQKNLKRGRGPGRDSLGSRTAVGQKTPKRLRGPTGPSTSVGGKENEDPSTVLARTENADVKDAPTPAADDEDAMDLEEAHKKDPNAPVSQRAGHGSMSKSTNEISKVRNLSQIQFGKHLVEPWYFSPYPVEFTEEDTIYICEFCLCFFGSPRVFQRHREKCTLLHPPGNEIYRDDYVSFFEVDGRRQRTWARNLSLLSKLFLDHKTVFSDVDPFLFYCMTTRDAFGCHLVGYFSKEKGSPDGYNVACILTLPQYQRSGFGRLLIEFSYTLSKREGKQGSPEKPLSDLGLLSYRAYWQETIVDSLLESKGEVTIDELATKCAMTATDVLHTLLSLSALKFYKGQHVVVLTDAVIAQKEKQREKARVKGKRTINPDKLIWKPPVFSGPWNW